MKKTYLTAALLAASMATPALAQQMGGSTDGSAMGSDSGGTMGSGDTGMTQESQVPESSQEATSGTQETQIPAGQSDQGSAGQSPADQSGQPMDSTQSPADESGQPSETQLPSDQSGQPLDQSAPSGSPSQQDSGAMSQPSDTQEATVPMPSGQAGNLDQSTVMQLQDALNQQGFNPGPTDGMIGPQTQSALRQFQQSKGIEASGQADQQTLAALGVQSGGSQSRQQQQQQDQQQNQAPSQP